MTNFRRHIGLKKNTLRITLFLFIIGSFTCFLLINTGCKCQRGKSKNNPDSTGNIEDSIKKLISQTEDSDAGSEPAISIDSVIDNVSSPVEMAALMLELGVPFSREFLSSTKNVDKYNTQFQKAINLGIFGADLGYLNMYNKTNVVMDYISAIRDLSNGIHVGQFFDFTTLKRLVTNNTNLDSLMLISVQSFNNMDQYLRENNSRNLSVLIIVGVWIEGMHFVTQVQKDNPDQKLKETIGDQKEVARIIFNLITKYKKDQFFKSLIEDFSQLLRIYDEVKITQKFSEPTPVEINGVLTFTSSQISVVEVSDETMNKIIHKIEEIRNKEISM